MDNYANKLIIYKFEIKATSPAYFGGERQGELIKNSEDKPILLGNSIGGALRDYLKSVSDCKEHQELVLKFMGGISKKKDVNDKFLDSFIYISDGKIEGAEKTYKKEGTAIDYDSGTAKENNKYSLEYLPGGTSISFKVECEVEDNCSEEIFNRIIGTWEKGFRNQDILLGGQQNNGFGRFKLTNLSKKEYVFRSSEALDEYIFCKDKEDFKDIIEGELSDYGSKKKNEITFSLEGRFPYGLYQAFKVPGDRNLTGLQKRDKGYYLPATSLKGIFRYEFALLVNKFVKDEKVNKKVDELFGSCDQKGKLVFFDVYLKDEEEIKVIRFERKDEDSKESKKTLIYGDPVYIKIDRITGGNIDQALKTQKEVYGKGKIECKLITDKTNDNPFIFPLIYIFRRIGSGLVPLGGRTVIGLGEYRSEQLKISGLLEESFPTGHIPGEKKEIVKNYYEAFKRWCEK